MNTLKLKTISILVTSILSIPTIVQADNTAFVSTSVGQSSVIGSAAAAAGAMDVDGFTNVLTTTLSNSGAPKDLIIGLTYETMLMTETVVRSKGGNKSTATADAEIQMYVTVDGKMAAPEIVTFDKRKQELWVELGGVMDCKDTTGAIDENGNVTGGGIISFDECTITDEEIGLILDTKAAHGFNFLSSDIGSGSHVIKAYARVIHNGVVVDGTDGSSSSASASLGKGTLAVWEVHGAMTTK